MSPASTISIGVTGKNPLGKAVLVIHGGAGNVTRERYGPELQAKYRAALQSALEAGYAVFCEGGCALDAVEAAVRNMEDNPLFNAGKGAVLTKDGTVELDASIMVSSPAAAGAAKNVDRSRRTTAVTMIQHVKNPITLAKQLYLSPEDTRHVLHAAPYVEKIASDYGLERVEEKYFHTPERDAQFANPETPDYAGIGDAKGTVGAVALDVYGNLAVGTSTGGMGAKLPGRIGDTPVPGAGYWCEEFTIEKKEGLLGKVFPFLSRSRETGMAVSGTGDGDYYLRYAVCHSIFERMRLGGYTLSKAMKRVLGDLGHAGGEGGVIGVTKEGDVVMEMNSAGMFRGWIDLKEGKARVGIFRDDVPA